MKYTAQHVCNQFPDLVISSVNADREFANISAANDYDHQSLVFINNDNQLAALTKPLPSIIVTRPEFAAALIKTQAGVITVSNVRLAQALIKQRYSDYDSVDAEWPTIHPSAVVHPSAKLAVGVHIGANTVIGRDVIVGKNTVIRANCVVEHDVIVGHSCIIHNLVNVGYGSLLGNRVIVRPGAIIGNEGFGFAQDEQYRHYRIPQTGIVEIGDDVQIGANCNIDRGTYGRTQVARGVKIDALCHIAHNVFIDEDALFVAQSGVAGSSNIGKRVIASGQTGVLDHKTVVDDAVLVHRCGVTEDITSSGIWAGTPPKPFKEYVRNLNSYQKLKRLETQIKNELQGFHTHQPDNHHPRP